MVSGTFRLMLVACVVTSSLWAASDPFLGKWKVNPSKSKLNDEMKVEVAGANKYAITFFPGAVDTIVADGSDQPALRGTTLSIAVKGANDWVVTRKEKGRTLLTGYWTLSEDGKTLNDAYTEYAPDGSKSSFTPYVYQRTAGSSGFPGTWDSDSEKVKAGIELEIKPYEDVGLSFHSPDEITKKVKFDGKDYPDLDPDEDAGSTCSGHRVNERSLELTVRMKGKVTSTRAIELSADLKTLTMIVRVEGQNRPKSMLVFERE